MRTMMNLSEMRAQSGGSVDINYCVNALESNSDGCQPLPSWHAFRKETLSAVFSVFREERDCFTRSNMFEQRLVFQSRAELRKQAGIS